MSPVKFKKSTKDRKGRVQNYYMKSAPLDDLLEALENDNTPPKVRQKIHNELLSRNYKRLI